MAQLRWTGLAGPVAAVRGNIADWLGMAVRVQAHVGLPALLLSVWQSNQVIEATYRGWQSAAQYVQAAQMTLSSRVDGLTRRRITVRPCILVRVQEGHR